jgi:hypothetical protein
MYFFVRHAVLFVTGIGVLLSISTMTQNEQKQSQSGAKSYFGVLLTVNTTGHDMIYAIITEDASGKSHKFISRQEFVNIALGKWRLKPNLKQENLFDKYGIVWGYDEDRDMIHVPILDSLWKVRYRQFPYIRGAIGWANDVYMPSPAQQIYLSKTFGVKNINTDFFAGENFWKLLQSAQSEDWKQEYKAMFD